MHVKPREIWWCNLGKNIGYEMNGKGDNFRRPVLIFKKVSSNHSIIVPLTTQEHFSKFFYKIKINKKENYLLFDSPLKLEVG